MRPSGKPFALLVAACVSFLTAAAVAIANTNAVPQPVLDALSRGEPQDLIVEFDARAILRQAEALRVAKAVPVGDAEILKGMARDFSSLKASALSSLKPEEYEVLRHYSHLPMVFLRVRSRRTLERLLERPDIVGAYRDETLKKVLAESLPLIRQPEAAAAGHRGAGTTVAILDGGVDYTRSAFGSCTSPGVPAGCKVVVHQEFADPDGTLDDPDLHGTNVSGIVLGVAPDSRIAALDIFNVDETNDSIVLEGVNWAIANKAQYNIVAMNLSLGGGSGSTAPCTVSSFTPAFGLARSVGILPVVASGNSGFTDRLSSPACTPGAVSVGAVYDSDVGPVTYAPPNACSDPTTASDQVPCFSNSADFLTLLAPAVFITAAGVTHQGTSQAAPHVSGAVAVLRSSHPTEVLEQTIARLTTTGAPVTDPRNGLIKPRINLEAAAAAPPPPAPPPPATCPGEPVSCPVTLARNVSAFDCTGGHLGQGYFADVYEFSGITGQTVTIEMSSPAAPDFDSFLVLISPSGAFAAYNDDIDLGVNVNSRLVFTLNATGTWRVEASTFLPGTTGDYSLSISGCSPPMPSICTPGPNTLCLSGGRFRVQTIWKAADGRSGAGNAFGLTSDTGYFWFFDAANVEMVVKVLDACGFAQRVWVFAGGLTNVEVTMIVTDTLNGISKTYINPQGTAFLPIQDTQAFATCSSSSVSLAQSGAVDSGRGSDPPRAAPPFAVRRSLAKDHARKASAAVCTPGPNALCLSGGRFRVQATWRKPDGTSGAGNAGLFLTSDTGYFWFFDSTNVEIVVKVLNACGFAQRIWVFSGGLTNVEVTMTVEDTVSGAVKTYTNPQGAAFLPIQDTQAFTTCP